jgi:hypothetical protein
VSVLQNQQIMEAQNRKMMKLMKDAKANGTIIG